MSAEVEGGVAARAVLAAGEVVGGKYTISSVVGEGGMGIVYEARHDRLGQQVALKVLRAGDDVHHDEIVARFEREARAAARLKSSHVARVYDVDQLPDGTPYIVMEYLDGLDLAEELRLRGVLPVDEAVNYVLQACSAVAEAHSLGIIHRDLKPQNLFLVGGTNRQVKLLDFGISKVLEEGAHSVTLTRSSLGTPLYMSPEQIRSSRSIDQRSDIWSLGVILYELVTGRPPFEGEGPTAVIAAITADDLVPPIERCPQIPRGLSEAIVKALEKDVTNRYQSVHELAQAITQYGPSGAWAEPLTSSSPSNPRISIHDAMTIRGEAATLLADSSNSNQPLALTPAPTAAPPRRGLWLGLGVGALVLLGALAASRLSSAPAPEAQRGPPLGASEVPVAPLPAPPAVPEERPRIDIAPVARSASPPPAESTQSARPKQRRPAPAAPTTAASPPTAAPPPPPANNPLHL